MNKTHRLTLTLDQLRRLRKMVEGAVAVSPDREIVGIYDVIDATIDKIEVPSGGAYYVVTADDTLPSGIKVINKYSNRASAYAFISRLPERRKTMWVMSQYRLDERTS